MNATARLIKKAKLTVTGSVSGGKPATTTRRQAAHVVRWLRSVGARFERDGNVLRAHYNGEVITMVKESALRVSAGPFQWTIRRAYDCRDMGTFVAYDADGAFDEMLRHYGAAERHPFGKLSDYIISITDAGQRPQQKVA